MLTEGGKDTGYGHVTRMLSIYQAFLEVGIVPDFFVRGDESVSSILKGVNYRFFDWLSSSILGILESYDVVVLDSYSIDYDFCMDVVKNVCLPVFFDDYRRLEYPFGIVVNGTLYAESLCYPKRENVRYLLGTKFLPLRREFWDVEEKKINREIKSILVTAGGGDTASIISKILAVLKAYPDITKFVVVSKAMEGIECVIREADRATILVNSPDGGIMREIMLESDIAISAGGQTSYELARIGVPAILFAIVENQLLNCEGWQRVGFARYVGSSMDDNLFENIAIAIEELRDPEVRSRMGAIGRNIVDGKGARRVVSEILKAMGRSIDECRSDR